MRPSRWGALIAGGLSMMAACTPPPPPEVPPPPAPPPPPPQVDEKPARPGELVDPPGAEKGLSSFTALFPAPWGATRPLQPTGVVAFGKGAMAYIDMVEGRATEPACLVAGVARDECQFLRFAPWAGTAPPLAAWRASLPGSGTGSWGPLVPAKKRWGKLSPGQDVVYGVRREGALTIDVINDKGEISTLLEGSAADHLTNVEVIELGGGALVALGQNENNELEAVEIARGAGGGAARVGETHPLKITPLGTYDGASYARYVIGSGGRVSFGKWAASPMLDKAGTLSPNWAIAWVEALPPPKYTPSGAPYKGPRPKPNAGPSLNKPMSKGPSKAKHGCGRSSRPLVDVSVEKRVHLMKMSPQGAVLEDKLVKVAPLPADSDEAQVVALRMVPGGIELNGHRFDEALAPQQGEAGAGPVPVAGPLARPPFEGTLPPSIVAAGYDAQAGEGIVVGAEGSRMGAQLFDGLGNAKSEPFALLGQAHLAPRSMPSVARAGGTWVALEAGGHSLLILNGTHAGETIDVSADSMTGRSSQTLAVLPLDETQVQVIRATWGTPREIMIVKVDVPNRTVTTVSSSSTRVHIAADEGAVHVMPGPGQGVVTLLGRRPNGTPVIGRLDSDGKWSDVPVKLDELVGETKHVHAHETWHDAVLVVEGDKGSTGFWGSSGQSAQLPTLGAFTVDEVRKRRAGGESDREVGPFLRGGKYLVDSQPGELVSVGEALPKQFSSCPYAFPTGPKRALLVCAEATESDKMAARVGMRVFRY